MDVRRRIGWIGVAVKRYWVWELLGCGAILIAAYGWLYWRPVAVTFDFAGSTCFDRLVIAPDVQQLSGRGYKIHFTKEYSLFGRRVMAGRTCLAPRDLPEVGTTRLKMSTWGSWLGRYAISLKVPKLPTVAAPQLAKPVPRAGAATFELSQADTTFTYRVEVNEKETICPLEESALVCPEEELGLEQGRTYALQVWRLFKGQDVEKVVDGALTILPAVEVISSSIANDQVVYDKPKSVELKFNKPLTEAVVGIWQGDAKVEAEMTLDEDRAVLAWVDDLARQKEYVLKVSKAIGRDESSLNGEYVVKFVTSGGPKVTGVSIGRSGVALGATAVISFDQEVQAKAGDLISVTGSGRVSVAGKTARVSLAGLGICQSFRLQVGKGVASTHDIVSEESWQFDSRMICHTTGTIGYSVRGRPITAYYFGQGSTVMLYTGTIHGNEVSAKRLMDRWIAELETHFDKIPAGRRVVIIPTLNPDGYVSGSRWNANGVDLNRNWEVSDWKTDITDTQNRPMPGAGGSAPMSEPETKALAALTTKLRPRLTMSFHAQGNVVIANQAADSMSLANTYSRLSGYPNETGHSSEVFEYQITGTYDDWILEKLGLASVLVELGSRTNAQWSRNVEALWAMLRS